MKFIRQFLILLIFLFSNNIANAQQTIFNVPSADVTEKGHIFLQGEGQFKAWGDDAFFNGTGYSAYGVGHNTEATLTLFNVSAPASHNISLGVGFKSAMPIIILKEKFPKSKNLSNL